MQMKSEVKWHSVFPWVVLPLLVYLLYGKFLSNPIFFDDLPFFMLDGEDAQPIDTMRFHWLEIRSLPYVTLHWTKSLFGLDLIPFRVGNLVLHSATTLALFLLLKNLAQSIYKAKSADSLTAEQAALLGAAMFAVHPVATYVTGYLVQRTILMATLFGILSLVFCIKSIKDHSPKWLWVTAILFYFSVYSKEHAITLVGIYFLVVYLMTNQWKLALKERIFPLTAIFLIALMIVFTKKGIIGTVYELEAVNMLGAQAGPFAYPYSVITQCTLFFKYIFLWILPQTAWMSIDMREPFARSFLSWQMLGFIAFLAWGGVGAYLLSKRGHKGLVGLAMLFPWMLFAPELSSVRIQEPFVLYRSYLWMGGLFLALPVILNGVGKKSILALSLVIGATLFMLSMERLATLSHPVLIWNDAKRLIDGKENIDGADRIYYNLARHLLLNDMLDDAESNINKALKIDPDFAQAHGILGAIHNKFSRWDAAIAEYSLAREINQRRNEYPSSIYLMGRARAYEGRGDSQKAIDDYLEACRIDAKVCEHLRKSATPAQ